MTPSKRAEADILQRALDGTIRVDSCGSTVSVFHRTRKQWYTKKVGFHRGRARYRFNGGGTVYRNRLVFIVYNRRLPEGFVDHVDGNKVNDHPTNLQDQSAFDSHKQGNDFQLKKYLVELCDWFDFMGVVQ